ncbi:hypothetical protein IEC_05394 [Bacillus toyonensis]|uniref:SLATT domain-containing protein n=1 Tax=Bacillus toyonensis TaxID=155322 RepID=UPI000278BEBA|nr:SLATT domain-containing protein [Bacillus toyonensis]EJQ32382.1 hypothetical protein IEC_05394 [Bacillus toyonensis]
MRKQRKLDNLLKSVDDNIRFFEGRRIKNKKKAFSLKVISIIMSSSITILLGLKSINNNNILSDIALGLAAAVTVFNGIEGFYNHRGLWAKDVTTLNSLRALKLDIEYYMVGEDEDSLSLEEVNKFKTRLQDILNEDVNVWNNIRKELDDSNKNEN